MCGTDCKNTRIDNETIGISMNPILAETVLVLSKNDYLVNS
jgi:hypothetical protein